MTEISTYAAIDIGSNTVQLMLADVEQGKIIANSNHIITTRLGAVDAQHNLTATTIAATAEAVASFCQMAKQHNCQGLRIIATSAVRDAANKADFLQAIAKITTTKVEILSGTQEALLSFLGAQNSLDFPAGTPVLDVGGSSTELIYQRQADADIFCKSINLGAVRMYNNNWDVSYIKQLIDSCLPHDIESELCVGVGGTITAIAGLILGLSEFDRAAIEGRQLSYDNLQNLLSSLQPLSVAERQSFSPLLKQRAEIIVPGLLIWLSLMDSLQIKKILVCGGGILDGTIVDMI